MAILANFKERNEDNKSKVEYFIELKRLYSMYFGYNEELMEYIMAMFNPHEGYNFLEMMENQRPMTIRVNTLKAKKKALA